MAVKKSSSRLTNKLIALFLTLQIILMGIQLNNPNEESSIGILIAMLNKCIALVEKVKDDEENLK